MAGIGRLSRTVPRSRLARLVASPAVRVWGWVVLLALLALVLGVLTLQHEREFAPPFSIPWLPIMAVAFFLGEANVVQVHFRRERHSFSLSELPGVIGLFVLPPSLYLVALLTGAGVALFRGGSTSTLKRSFNLANFALTAVVSLALFHSIASLSGVPGPQDWLAAFATTTATSLIGAVAVATAISLSGGAPQYQKLPEMLQFSLMVALANTSLALLAVTVLWVDPRSIVLLVVPIAIVIVAYRAYVAEREKHERLELLYQSSRILQHSPELDSAIAALLEHSRGMFRAERAEILLFPDPASADALRTVAAVDGRNETMTPVTVPLDDRLRATIAERQGAFVARPSAAWTRIDERIHEAMVAPLVGERGLLGAMTVVDRMGEGSTFDADDVRLLETIANQAAVALENGQLEQSLNELSRLKEQLRHQAYHDSLTGLANRALFVEQVERRLAAVADASTAGRPVPRPRRLQGRQRHAGPRRRRPAPGRGRRAHPARDPRRGPRGPAGRRRVRGPARATGTDPAQRRAAWPSGSSTRCRRRSRRRHRGRRSAPASASRRPRPGDRPRRRAAAQRGRRDVRGQGATARAATRCSTRRCTHAIVERHDAQRRAGPERPRTRRARACTTSRSSSWRPAGSIGVEALVRWRHPTRGSIGPGGVHPRSPRRPARSATSALVVLRRGRARRCAAWQQQPGLERR